MLQTIREIRACANIRRAVQLVFIIALFGEEYYVASGWAQPRGPDSAPNSAVTSASGPPAPGGMIRHGGKGLESTSLEDLMLEKGMITMDDWIRIKADEEQRFNERSVVAEFTGSPRWFDRISMFGYGMFRYNNTSNGELRTYHDASVGDKNNGAQPGFFFRRIRWVVTGQVSDHVSFFIQPDLASNVSGNTHVLIHARRLRGLEFRQRQGIPAPYRTPTRPLFLGQLAGQPSPHGHRPCGCHQ